MLSDENLPRKGPIMKDLEVDDICERLLTLQSCNDGERLLASIAATKQVLLRIAHKLDVPIRSGDRKERICQRIIDAAIGYRVSAKIIRGR